MLLVMVPVAVTVIAPHWNVMVVSVKLEVMDVWMVMVNAQKMLIVVHVHALKWAMQQLESVSQLAKAREKVRQVGLHAKMTVNATHGSVVPMAHVQLQETIKSV